MVPQEGTSEVRQWRAIKVGPHGDHDPIYRLSKECVMNVENLDIFLTIVLSYKRKVDLQVDLCRGPKSQERERPRTCTYGSTMTRSWGKQSILLNY